jgi:hypothetical protein
MSKLIAILWKPFSALLVTTLSDDLRRSIHLAASEFGRSGYVQRGAKRAGRYAYPPSADLAEPIHRLRFRVTRLRCSASACVVAAGVAACVQRLASAHALGLTLFPGQSNRAPLLFPEGPRELIRSSVILEWFTWSSAPILKDRTPLHFVSNPLI